MTRTIQLTQGYEAIIDDEDYEAVSKHKWCAIVKRGGHVYATTNMIWRSQNRRTVAMHQFIIAPPPRTPVDHRDRDTLNNRRSNLRVCTSGQNAANSKLYKNKTGSRFKGVRRNPKTGLWRSEIQAQNKVHWVGSFDCDVEAALAFDDAARHHHGEFASTNESLGLLPTFAWVDWEPLSAQPLGLTA